MGKISKTLKTRIDALLLRMYLHSPFSRPLFANYFLKLVWYSRLRQWCRQHPCSESEWRPGLYRDLVASEHLDGPIDYLEFGVYKGWSINFWLGLNNHHESRFYGFDTFTGLPEDWHKMPKGTFSTQGNLPDVSDSRCHFIKGLFQDTLPVFLKDYVSSSRKVIHCDADLFSSTLFVLGSLGPLLRAGDILIFDEFDRWLHEFRAFIDFLEMYPIRYEAIRRAANWTQVAIRIESDTLTL